MNIAEETMLVFVSGEDNNNKFYHVTIDDAGVVRARWGRVGTEGLVSDKGVGADAYAKTIRAKERKGYQRTNIATTLDQRTSAPSSVLGDKDVLTDIVLNSLAGKVVAKTKKPVVSAFVKRLVADNRHAISETSGGRITVSDDGVARTALGVVSADNITSARALLNRMADDLASDRPVAADDLNNYLTLIPQKVPTRGNWTQRFFTEFTTAQEQRDLLDQLDSSIAIAASAVKKALDNVKKDDQPSIKFRYSIDLVAPSSDEFKRINKMFESSKNSQHHRSVANLKLKRVFAVRDSAAQNAKFEAAKKELGNVRELWHGTPSSNLLSILRKGMFVPPTSGTSIRIAGRMFGDGIYFSDQSTKALNYSHGFWGGVAGNRDNCFMLLSEVVLGNEFRPYQNGGWSGATSVRKAHTGTDAKGRKFDSISIKGGTCGVLNNEIIVWNTDQIRVTYICEFDR